MTTTGDLNGNTQRLLREVRSIKYPADVDEVGLRLGDPVALLPLLSFSLLKFSRHVARFIVRNGFELAGKTDQRFVEASFRMFRDLLNVRTVLTPAQFFEHGFAERKVLLLCDVITVCKKLHNEEVRQERLAALKATRQQEHVSSRLAAPRAGGPEPTSSSRPPAPRRSPVVKVVRNGDDVEIVQVLAATHQPNATDGAQSIYRTRQTISRSPSPSPAGTGLPGAGVVGAVPRPHSSPSKLQSSRKGDSMELTFRPAAKAQAQAGPGTGPQQQQQPIHAWFLNPAFDEGAEGSADLGLGLSGTGRPDSSAWWQSAPTPGLHAPATGAWAQAPSNPYLATAARASQPTPALAAAGPRTAGSPGGAGGEGAAAGLRSTRRPFVGGQPVAAVAQPGTRPHGGVHPQQQQQSPVGRGAAVGGSPASGAGYQAREIDEWSFSRFFGPGKGPGKQQDSRGGGSGTRGDTDSSQELGGADDVDGAEVRQQDEYAEAYDGKDVEAERGGPPSDQDPPLGGAGRSAQLAGGWEQHRQQEQQAQAPPHYGGSGTRQAAAPAAAGTGPSQHHAAGFGFGGAGGSRSGLDAGGAGAGGEVDWQARMVQLERETQQQLQQLREKLAVAEEELEKCRLEARQSREALQARVTVLEGRVCFLECEMELCVKRQPGTGTEGSPRTGGGGGGGFLSPSAAAAAATAPSAAASPPREGATAAWRSYLVDRDPQPGPGRPRSAGGALQTAAMPSPSAAGLHSSSSPPRDHHYRTGHYLTAGGSSPTGPAPATAVELRASLDRYWARDAQGTQPVVVGTARPASTHPVSAAGATTWTATTERTAPDMSTAQNLSRASLMAAGPGSYLAPSQPMPPQRTSQAAQQPSGPSAASAAAAVTAPTSRMHVAFSPMPQPSFSFQPSSLMQQVAASASESQQGPPLSHAEQAKQQQQQRSGYGATPSAAGPASYRGSLDSASASARYGYTGTGGETAAAVGGSISARGSLDSSLQPGSGAGLYAAPGAAAAGGTGVGSGSSGSYGPAWRAPDRPAGRPGGAGSSILDGVVMGGQQQQRQQPDGAAGSQALAGLDAYRTGLPSHSYSDATPGSVAVAAAAAPTAGYGGAAASLVGGSGAQYAAVTPAVASMAFPPASAGPGTGSSGGFRNTDDLINSLYMRYTEAQDFLQSIRKR